MQAEELIEIARKVLRLMGVTDYGGLELTYVLKTESAWKVSFTYIPSMSFVTKTGSFRVNAESGEIEGMWLDRTWK